MAPERLLVDTDAGLDDALALLHVARHPAVEVVAVGSVHGNIQSADAARNTLRLLELQGAASTPVAVGASAPLAQQLHLGHPEDPLGSVIGPAEREPSGEAAADQLVRLARAHPGEISVLALGPLTNLAQALDAEPELPELLHRVVAMGGAAFSAGNITDHAESNIWHDPDAADAVFAAGFDLTLVGLDVTRDAVATAEWLRAVAANPDTLWGQFAGHLLQQHDGNPPPLPMHDALAAAILVRPDLAEYERVPIQINLTDGPERGRTVTAPDANRTPTAVATRADTAGFLQELLETVSS